MATVMAAAVSRVIAVPVVITVVMVIINFNCDSTRAVARMIRWFNHAG